MPSAAFALSVQVPTDRFVTVVPDTVHTPLVELEKVTGSPDELVAATVKVPLDPI